MHGKDLIWRGGAGTGPCRAGLGNKCNAFLDVPTALPAAFACFYFHFAVRTYVGIWIFAGQRSLMGKD